MKCPACFNPLTSVTIGRLTADVCRGSCGGVWFDAFELQQVDEPDESAGEWLVNIERDSKLRVDFNRKRACPKCDGFTLKRRHFSAKRLVEIDECPGCGGCWLDAGELGKIRDETGETTRQKEALAATQLRLTAPVLRYLYQIRVDAGK
ncbi:MAG TPA: zf-TFIIB domain-containing protein [Candidatus Angelobacter sp.]|nr:zf-TFIIB domain-containing protein [Candidatus Angelobacter sp.]